ncbi:MAG: Uma2 family endonuclease, partial [Pseudanabaena sp.]
MVLAATKRYTPSEYIALEDKAEFKSEYINGEIIPMAGASANHNK